MRTFEYKFAVNVGEEGEFGNLENGLNRMGDAGWDLISVVSTSVPVPARKGRPTLLYFFKREKETGTPS